MSAPPPVLLKLPYSQQFSPKQTPLLNLLPILHVHAGKKTLRKAVASAFHKSKNDSDGLAGNTLIALRSWGIIGSGDSLTSFGSDLTAIRGDDAKTHRMLATHLLLNLNGIFLVETLREMTQGGHRIDLTSLPSELLTRGIQASRSSSDLSGALGWLRAAAVVSTNYIVDVARYRELSGASLAALDAFRGMTPEQVAFLRAIVSLGITELTPYAAIVRHAELLYPGEVHFNWKDIPAMVIYKLQADGLVEFHKNVKQAGSVPQGRGGKPGFVKPTKKFEQEIAEPLLKMMFKSARSANIREIRRKPLSEIVSELKSNDGNKSGRALEYLAVRICMLLDLDFLSWRETDEQVTAGGEVDALLHSARLIYSRWQVQCKRGNITLEAIAKEVGMQTVTLANVILVVSNGRVTEGARTYREHQSRTSHLNVIYIDNGALQRIIKDPTAIVEILKLQSREALSLKPYPGLRDGPQPVDVATVGFTDAVRETPATSYSPSAPERLPAPLYQTKLGAMYLGDSLQLLPGLVAAGYRAKLIVTSPPFALVRKKEYGNEDSDTYIEWFAQFIPLFKQLLEPQGSLVLDIGGAWIRGIAAKSTYQFKLLLRLCESGFYLAQDFYHFNPSKLPTPAEWVTIRRLRVKDAVNNVWWLMQDPMAPVDNRRVLAPYSSSMKDLLKNGYKAAVRPSGHDISDKFQKDNGGAIPPNLLTFANTESNSHYIRRCREEDLKPHPARFPLAFADWFIRFLTNPNDLVIDPFGGSNVTGAAAELLGRRWISTELREDYARASKFRFEAKPAAVVYPTSRKRKRQKNRGGQPTLF